MFPQCFKECFQSKYIIYLNILLNYFNNLEEKKRNIFHIRTSSCLFICLSGVDRRILDSAAGSATCEFRLIE